MNVDLYTNAGEKKGTVELPKALFEAPIREGLMHFVVTVQRSNRRFPIAHAKTRGEVHGSTRKLYAQKHTGRARRGPARTPIVKGGGRSFGPTRERNFHLRLPREQRRQALLSSLSSQARAGRVFALESYPEDVKTKTFVSLYRKLPVSHGRTVLFVLPAEHRALSLSSRNVPGVHTMLARFLNPYEVLRAHQLVFLKEALGVAEEVFGEKKKKSKSSKSSRKTSSISSKSSHSSSSS
jgi:large subunit ribosomal protein L4